VGFAWSRSEVAFSSFEHFQVYGYALSTMRTTLTQFYCRFRLFLWLFILDGFVGAVTIPRPGLVGRSGLVLRAVVLAVAFLDAVYRSRNGRRS